MSREWFIEYWYKKKTKKNTKQKIQRGRVGRFFQHHHSLKFQVFLSHVGLLLHIYTYTTHTHTHTHTLTKTHKCLPECAHTLTLTYTISSDGLGSLKETWVGPAAPWFQARPPPQKSTTVDFMADHSGTHKHTCSVLRHVEKWRFLIVTPYVLIWQCLENIPGDCSEKTLRSKRYLWVSNLICFIQLWVLINYQLTANKTML